MKKLQLLVLTVLLNAPLLAATSPGTVIGWGSAKSGGVLGISPVPLGVPSTASATGAISVAGQVLSNAVGIAAGDSHGLALRADATVAGWGWNVAGQATGVRTPFPGTTNGCVRIAGQTLSNVTAVAAARQFSLALRNNGTVAAWGELESGESMSVPAGLSNIVSVSAGYDHGLALRSDGIVAIFGRANRPPSSLSNVTAIAACRGPYGVDLALKRDGTVVGWELRGIGTRPTVPPGLSNVVAIAAGWHHSLALRTDGTVLGWGDNTYGAATGTRTYHSPSEGSLISQWGVVEIGGAVLREVCLIAAGEDCSLALKHDGTVVAWGRVDNGLTPATVPAGLSGVVAIAAGENFCLAITTNANWAPPKK